MNLATRCPACGTVFRVVPDQLKVSEGWVRCGRCAEVFDGAQRLFELEAAAPSATPAPLLATPGGATAHPTPEADTPPTLSDAPADAAPAPRLAPHAAPPATACETAPEAPFQASTNEAVSGTIDADASARHDDVAGTNGANPVATTAVRTETEAALGVATAAADPDAAAQDDTPLPAEGASSDALPQFMRHAERAARWQQPRRRGLLAGLALLLTVLLAAQWALHYRDDLAARWPAATAPLQAACELLGCRVQAPRRIDALNVDSSGLARLPDSAHYRLSLVLQNKAATVVHMPAIELTLTDTQGHAVVRRVLSAAELGQAGDRLAPRSELALQATLDLGERRVAGYTVELFYP